VALKLLISATPDCPAQSACQLSSTPIPSGVTSPIPVMTTRLSNGPPFRYYQTLTIETVLSTPKSRMWFNPIPKLNVHP
jgi:hypothetical protein